MTLLERLFPIGEKIPPRPIRVRVPRPSRLTPPKVRLQPGQRRNGSKAAGIAMSSLRLPLLGGVALFLLLLLVGGSGSSSSHSLRYFVIGVSELGPGLPRFIAVGYVDDQPIVYYDSDTKQAQPKVPWMEKVGKDDPQYWDTQSQIAQGNEAVFRANLETLRNRFNQSRGGLHMVQVMYGCQVGPDGQPSGGWQQDAYDGEDFIAFDKETLTWTAPVPQAEITKRRWEAETQDAQYQKAYLEETCVEWLRRYLDYGKEALLRTEAPAVKVARKKGYDGRETLICRAHGFYPKEIDVSWKKDEQDQKHETQTGGVSPNLDGTYHMWLSIEVDSQERERYHCRVEHDSLTKPLDLAYEDPASNLGLILGILAALLAALILLGAGVTFYLKRRDRPEGGYKVTPGSDQGSDNSCKVSLPEA